MSAWRPGWVYLTCLLAVSCGGGQTTPSNPNVPVITSVSPAGTVGSVGGWVRFHATATNAPTSFAWDFGGGGTTSDTSADPRVDLAGLAGTFTGSVRAQNASGLSHPESLSFAVSGSTIVPAWKVSPCPGGSAIYGKLAVLIAHGRLYIVSQRASSLTTDAEYNLQIASAPIESLNDSPLWSAMSFADTDHVGGFLGTPLMGLNDGILMVYSANRVENNRLVLGVAYCPSPIPTQPSDWQIHEIHAARDYLLCDVGGTPVLAYTIHYSAPVLERVCVAIPQVVPPTREADWQEEQLWFAPPDPTQPVVITALPNGGVGLAYEDSGDEDVQFAYRSNLMGSGESHWTRTGIHHVPPDTATAVAALPDKVVVSISHGDPTGAFPWVLAYSSTPTGIDGTWRDFTVLDASPQSGYVLGGSLQVWGGRLIAEAHDNAGLSLMRVLGSDLSANPGTATDRILAIPPRTGDQQQLSVTSTAMTTAGKDLYVLFSDADPFRTGPLRLAIPEGSW